MSPALNKKICIIGDFAVGKTSLVRRYVLDQFSADYQVTLGVNVYRHTDTVEVDGEPRTVNLILWDIEGMKDASELINTYLRGASGALVVGDVTRGDAIDSLRRTAQAFLEIQPGRPVVFALNKIDLNDDRVGRAGSDALGEEFGGAVLRTSAATGETVSALFHDLARRVAAAGL